jgi:hypothetical protein
MGAIFQDRLADWPSDFNFDFELSSAVRRYPAGNALSADAEESPSLEAVTGKRPVKTLQAGKDLACTLVICKVWR